MTKKRTLRTIAVMGIPFPWPRIRSIGRSARFLPNNLQKLFRCASESRTVDLAITQRGYAPLTLWFNTGGSAYERNIDGECPNEFNLAVLSPHASRIPLGNRRRVWLRGSHRLAVGRWLFRFRASRREVRQPACAQEADDAGQCEERHLHLLLRRTQPRRYVRLQAEALSARRENDPGEDLRPRRAQERRPRRWAEVRIQALWQVRQDGERFVSAHWHVRRRHCIHPQHVRGIADPRVGDVDDEFRPDPLRPSGPRLLGHLWPGEREREFPRLRGYARSQRAARFPAPRTGRAAICRPPTRGP